MADVKWIKIVTDIFDNRKIKQIEAMPKGDSILVVWFKLLCLAGKVNEDGMLLIAENIPFDVKSFANEFKKSAKIVQLAIDVFLQYDMIQVSGNTVVIKNWEEYQNTVSLEKIRDQTRERVRRYRQRNTPQGNVNSNVTKTLPVTLDNATEEDIDIDKDITPPISPPTEVVGEKRKSQSGLIRDDEALQIIGQWTENQPLRDTLMEFVKHRRAIKKPMTEYALKRLFPKLKSIAGSEEEQIEVLSQSIVNGWQGVFAPRDQQSWQSDKSGSAANATITDDEYLRMKREHEERLRRK